MNQLEIRELMNTEWTRINREAEKNKNSQSATFMIIAFYRGLSDVERSAADRVLVEWIFSNDPKKQFDALAVIDECAVFTAIPALKQLTLRFSESHTPSSEYDLAKVNRILERLTK